MSGFYDDIFMARFSAFNPYRLRHRDMGFPTPRGAGDALAKSLYCEMKATFCWLSNDPSAPTGGIYNLEFSPDGSLLVAACERMAIQIFDPLNHNRIHCMVGAHMDCVNGVKFLDSRMFATCSDDTTIALWDIRNLNKKICSLVGHSKWVKNIEFSKKDKLLVTSGLDGSIYTWDINSFARENVLFSRVFHTTSLMRCKLSPDSKQMILSTTGGLIMLIHNLNLATLAPDLLGFKPNLYRLMQMSLQDIPVASKFDCLFDADLKENRVEFVTDFPRDNDAEVVSSLQIHPQGWTALSRNISHDDTSEWTCIHDIQAYEERSDKSTRDPSPQKTSRSRPKIKRPEAPCGAVPSLRRSPRINQTAPTGSAPRRRSSRLMGLNPYPVTSAEANRTGAQAIRARAVVNRIGAHANRAGARANRTGSQVNGDAEENGTGADTDRTGAQANGTEREDARVAPVAGPSNMPPGAGPAAAGILFTRGIPNDLWEASISIKQNRILQDLVRRGSVRRNFNMQRITGYNTGISPPIELSSDNARPSPEPEIDLVELTPRRIVPVIVPDDGDDSDYIAPTPRRIMPVIVPDDGDDSPTLSGRTQSEVDEDEWATIAKMRKIRQNRKRLLYYVEETNQGKGFIKELCYSSDGRIVCSPFGKGIRLMALDENCSEIPSVVQHFDGPRQMHEIGHSLGFHNDLVVCTKFNPRFHSLVSGCLEGKIVWYQPHSGMNI